MAVGRMVCTHARISYHTVQSTLPTIGGLLLVPGAFWFLQGVNALSGSLTDQTGWAAVGGDCVAVGLVSLILSG